VLAVDALDRGGVLRALLHLANSFICALVVVVSRGSLSAQIASSASRPDVAHLLVDLGGAVADALGIGANLRTTERTAPAAARRRCAGPGGGDRGILSLDGDSSRCPGGW
jgi:hypothetical protein